MIKFFRLSKQGEVLRKGSANLFSERAGMPRGQKQNQRTGRPLVEMAACGKTQKHTS
jgi:hypothetical protein